MKFSKYNSIISLNEKDSLLFNAYTKMFIVFDSSLKEKLVDDQIDYLNLSHNSLYLKLIESKSLIEDDTDELSQIKEISTIANYNTGNYILIINPTLDCNFRCWYCYESHKKGSQMDEETLSGVRKFIKKKIHSDEIEIFYLSFFGGEPLLKYIEVVEPLMEFSQEVCNATGKELVIGMTTNGYLFTEEIINSLLNYHISGIQITLDGCREDHNKVRNAGKGRDSYQVILDNMKMLLKHKIPVSLRINYTAKNIRKALDIKHDLVDLTDEMRGLLNVNLQRVWQDKDDPEANTGSEISNINSEMDELIYGFKESGINGLYFFNDRVESSCYADKANEALINYNGDVFKCTARDFTTENRYGYLDNGGEIVWEKERLEKRLNARFKNPSCLKCRIAPICSGGCSQVILENNYKDYCLYDFDENRKDQVILDYFENQFVL